jgi:hypothetical protein
MHPNLFARSRRHIITMTYYNLLCFLYSNYSADILWDKTNLLEHTPSKKTSLACYFISYKYYENLWNTPNISLWSDRTTLHSSLQYDCEDEQSCLKGKVSGLYSEGGRFESQLEPRLSWLKTFLNSWYSSVPHKFLGINLS